MLRLISPKVAISIARLSVEEEAVNCQTEVAKLNYQTGSEQMGKSRMGCENHDINADLFFIVNYDDRDSSGQQTSGRDGGLR
jgi:hypothetical protein